MQWIGETINATIAGSLDADVEQIATPFGRDLLQVLQAMQDGDFSIRMSGGHDGLCGQIADAVNMIATAHQLFAQQIARIGDEIGRESRTRQRVKLSQSGGDWGEIEAQLNGVVDNLLWPTATVMRTAGAAANADLTQSVDLDIDGRPLKGDFLRLATIINAMIRQLDGFTTAMTRVAREATIELERSKSRLQDSEDGRVLALAAGGMGSWDWDLASGTCLWDTGQQQIFGADPTSFQVALPALRTLVDRNDWKRVCRQLNRARQNGGAWQLEFRVRRPDGSVRWCLGTAVAARDAAGRICRIRGITMDITERKEAEDRQLLLVREVDHRTKNALAVVHAIVSLTRADDIEQFSAAVEGRVQALARAHNLLSDSRWRGAKIADLVQGELAAFRATNSERIRLSGRSLTLHPSAVQALALAVHELAANAARHGALSLPSGSVQVSWEQRNDELLLRWLEFCAPSPRRPVQEGAAREISVKEGLVKEGVVKEGLGMRIIRASIETQLRGSAVFEWHPEGLSCVIRIPCHAKTELSGNFLYSVQSTDAWRSAPTLS